MVGSDLSAFAGREVYVDVEVIGKATGSKPIIVTDYLISRDQRGPFARSGAIFQESEIPTVYSLHQNYPNPFNPSTTIGFDLPEAQRVKLVVYNILGEEVKVVVDEYVEAGIHSRSVQFMGLPSGVYLYRITAGRFSESKKLLVLK